MKITDEIRNYEVKEALSSELMKTSEEYLVLGMLKHCDPIQFGGLRKRESPDLQDEEHSLGIEITCAVSVENQIISGESIKYTHARSDEERQESLRLIRRNGGDRKGFCTSYPVGTAEKDKKNVEKAYKLKLSKLKSYKEKCSRVGLVITIDIPLFMFEDMNWGNCLTKEENENFDFIIFKYWSGFSIYDPETDKYTEHRIEREDMDALKRLGRMAAEGIISDDDPVWQ